MKKYFTVTGMIVVATEVVEMVIVEIVAAVVSEAGDTIEIVSS